MSLFIQRFATHTKSELDVVYRFMVSCRPLLDHVTKPVANVVTNQIHRGCVSRIMGLQNLSQNIDFKNESSGFLMRKVFQFWQSHDYFCLAIVGILRIVRKHCVQVGLHQISNRRHVISFQSYGGEL